MHTIFVTNSYDSGGGKASDLSGGGKCELYRSSIIQRKKLESQETVAMLKSVGSMLDAVAVSRSEH